MRFFGILFSLGVILAPVPSQAAPRKGGEQADSASLERLTRIRAGTPAFFTVSSRRGRELKHLNVEVRNTGQIKARGVEVRVEFSGGLMYPLRGVRSLEPGQAGLYILKGATATLAGSSPRVVAQCSNCRR